MNLAAVTTAKEATTTPKNSSDFTLGEAQARSDETLAINDNGTSEDVSPEMASEEQSSLGPPSETAMQEYYQLQQRLLGLTAAFGAVIFPFVWGFYSLQIALDYMLGACVGVVYLRMLGKGVGTIGRKEKNSSAGRLAVVAGVLIVAMRWDQLDVMPVFLGFLTYKAAIIAFVLWTSAMPQRNGGLK